jgi:hypothetical protein
LYFVQEKIALIFGYEGDVYESAGAEYSATLEVSSDTGNTFYGPQTVEGMILAALDVARGIGIELPDGKKSESLLLVLFNRPMYTQRVHVV